MARGKEALSAISDTRPAALLERLPHGRLTLLEAFW
jgi:hypothetical protein